jgi:hypothetical protein
MGIVIIVQNIGAFFGLPKFEPSTGWWLTCSSADNDRHGSPGYRGSNHILYFNEKTKLPKPSIIAVAGIGSIGIDISGAAERQAF